MAAQRRTRIEWQRLTDDLRNSGLTQREFATQQGLNAKTLENWVYRLRREAMNRTAPAQFLPIRVLSAASLPSALHGGALIEVAVGERLRLRFSPGVDCDYLGRLVSTLATGAAC
jgi:hypothetical protein